MPLPPYPPRSVDLIGRVFPGLAYFAFYWIKSERAEGKGGGGSKSSVEKILEFSGAKWYTPGLEPVIVHDILSDSIPDIRDNDSMEITAMMHEVKEDGDLLNSTSDLNLEDDPDLSNMPVDLQDYLDEWKGYSTFPGRDLKAYETIANSMDQIMPEEPKETGEETRSHSGPPGEE